MKRKKSKFRLGYTQIILLSFLAVILIGAALLCFPISSKAREWTDFTSALFTATSATCVTGLVVYDTFTHWSGFGQAIILLMIQIGGLGLMTIVSSLALLFSKSMSLRGKTIAMQSSGAITLKDVSKTLMRIVKGTALFEFIGAVLLAIRFIPEFGAQGIWFSVFHSVSAFCNAGFDLMGIKGEFSSLTSYATDPLVSLTIAFLVIIGGISFIVWKDVADKKLHLKHYSLHSKLALTVTAVLLTLGTVSYFFAERSNAFSDMNVGEQILASFFQSVTMRTAGFCTVDQAKLSEASIVLGDFLMLIGGTSGSTAGGLKTTTFAILIASVVTQIKGTREVVVFKRGISEENRHAASSIAIIYIIAVVIASTLILGIEGHSQKAVGVTTTNVVYEVISAIATVGITRGITTILSTASRYVLIAMMFAGRIGGLSFLLAFAKPHKTLETKRPSEDILIG